MRTNNNPKEQIKTDHQHFLCDLVQLVQEVCRRQWLLQRNMGTYAIKRQRGRTYIYIYMYQILCVKKQKECVCLHVSYTLRRLVRRGCFSFEKRIRDVFKWKRVVFEDGEKRTVPSVSGVGSFKSQN